MKTAACKFCGQVATIGIGDSATEEEVIEAVTEECNCEQAQIMRKLKDEAYTARKNIDEFFGDKHPDAAELLKKAIEPIQHGRIKEVNIKITSKLKGSIVKTSKDSIKVSRVYNEKEELDTE